MSRLSVGSVIVPRVTQTSLMTRLFGSSSSTANLSTAPLEPPTVAQASGVTGPSASMWRAEAVAVEIAMSIPSVRKAVHVIAGTPSTFTLAGWEGSRRLPDTDPRCSWLRQPDPRRTLTWLIRRTITDGIWHDRCLWDVTRDIAGRATRFERVHPSRVSTISEPHDPDTVAMWVIDGKGYSDAEVRARYLVFDFAGTGGLRRYGASLLGLYGDLQAAAGNYARAPHPKAILKNAGPDLTDDEIDDLLADWEAHRDVSSIGYLNSTMTYDTVQGWSPEQLQLVEAREHAALETARLFALPAKAVDAKSGDSMTYGTVVEYRRDLLEALRPWMTTFTQTLSLDDRSAAPRGLILPRGVRAEFDVDAFTRDDPGTRMTTWAAGIASGVLTIEDAQAAEPLARKA